jgi:hypothetical protein
MTSPQTWFDDCYSAPLEINSLDWDGADKCTVVGDQNGAFMQGTFYVPNPNCVAK